jgi:DNA-binding transcriptional regulator LsrR (DeoR family)
MPRKTTQRTFSSLGERERNELAFQAAQLFFEQGLARKRIAKVLDLSDARVVSKLLNYARDQGIVNITIQKQSAIYVEPQRDSNLEEILVEFFDQLEGALVVNIPSYQDCYDVGEDDRVHQILGRALAEELRTVLRVGDHIGVTGGRATSACAQSVRILGRGRPFSQDNIIVTSLAGGVSRIPEFPPVELLSADDVAITLAAGLRGARRRLLSVPWITVASDSIPLKYPSEQIISEEEWAEDTSFVPNVGVVGVGIIKEGLHPFFYEDKPELDPIRDLLRALKEQVRVLGYDAVGDLGQRLFVIDPPEGFALEQIALGHLSKLVDEINSHVMAPTFAQLRQISLLIVVAGGEYKRNALWTVLTKPEVWTVRRLCTDSETAGWLVERKRKTE